MDLGLTDPATPKGPVSGITDTTDEQWTTAFGSVFLGTVRLGLAMVAKTPADELGPAGVRSIPLGRYGAPEEFGRVGAFLLSLAASFVSGSMLPADGGMLRAL